MVTAVTVQVATPLALVVAVQMVVPAMVNTTGLPASLAPSWTRVRVAE